jgi:hypothetical protein
MTGPATTTDTWQGPLRGGTWPSLSSKQADGWDGHTPDCLLTLGNDAARQGDYRVRATNLRGDVTEVRSRPPYGGPFDGTVTAWDYAPDAAWLPMPCLQTCQTLQEWGSG